MDTFRGHRFWVGALAGGLFVWYVLPRIMAYAGARQGS